MQKKVASALPAIQSLSAVSDLHASCTRSVADKLLQLTYHAFGSVELRAAIEAARQSCHKADSHNSVATCIMPQHNVVALAECVLLRSCS